ncbi:class I SAM-dependent methyltransferase [Propionispira raffinosivorans]|uniref:class I SAM-dependent methyltransferase n=1 Tax=Propionispira raffinosivorans TaxID=86959 RepID=UPI00036B2F1C|nr:class I SAM-dependent methyltransferase [Propionispira raffinosivorans]
MAIFHQSKIKIAEEIDVIDMDIRQYIETNKTDQYDEVIQKDPRWEVFYHLSDLRMGLFSWYDFTKESDLLEIGAAFGALTGLFCRKCARVTALEEQSFRAESVYRRYAERDNLTVYAGGIATLPSEIKFDYIILAGGLETIGKGNRNPQVYADYVRQLRAFLKPTGVLLIAVENRYGLKYFCGAQEPHANRSFAGISGFMKGALGKSFTKNELENILEQAGVLKRKFYYPLPDYKLPQLVYTDAYLPEKNVQERLIPYSLNPKTLLANENDLYDDIVAGNVFPFFANSYLIECGQPAHFSKVIYAAISTDRGRNRAFATVIYSDQRVCKKPIFDEGIAHAKTLVSRTTKLEDRGVPMVPHVWDGTGVVMPRIQANTLSNYLKESVTRHPGEFLNIIERLWQLILQSAEYVSPEKNALLREENLQWGPILEQAYLELIPLNCFYHNGDFLFFDQEYVKENYPAKYVLFRAIHYIYVFTPQMKRYISLDMLKEKYGLTELWDIFLQEENEHFLHDVRQHELYWQFYRWAAVDTLQMQRNASLLGLDEKRCHDLFAELFEGPMDRQIVIFCAGSIFDSYMRKHGKEHTPIFVADNDTEKWGTKRCGVEIRNPQEILNVPENERQVIVCSRFYWEVGAQLEKMGVAGYKVYTRE